MILDLQNSRISRVTTLRSSKSKKWENLPFHAIQNLELTFIIVYGLENIKL